MHRAVAPPWPSLANRPRPPQRHRTFAQTSPTRYRTAESEQSAVLTYSKPFRLLHQLSVHHSLRRILFDYITASTSNKLGSTQSYTIFANGYMRYGINRKTSTAI
jgi:hypothetical protein